MAFVVETGSGVDGAESYVSAAEWSTWATAHNVTPSPAPSTAAIEAALRDAAEWLEGHSWVGSRASTAVDRLDWPRSVAFASDPADLRDFSGIVPEPLKKAQCRLALSVLVDGSIAAANERSVKRQKVGDIELEYEPSGAAHAESRSFPAVESLLAPLLTTPTGAVAVRMVRY